MRSFRSKPVGWRNESYRHYLAAKGIKTNYMKLKRKYSQGIYGFEQVETGKFYADEAEAKRADDEYMRREAEGKQKEREAEERIRAGKEKEVLAAVYADQKWEEELQQPKGLPEFLRKETQSLRRDMESRAKARAERSSQRRAADLVAFVGGLPVDVKGLSQPQVAMLLQDMYDRKFSDDEVRRVWSIVTEAEGKVPERLRSAALWKPPSKDTEKELGKKSKEEALEEAMQQAKELDELAERAGLQGTRLEKRKQAFLLQQRQQKEKSKKSFAKKSIEDSEGYQDWRRLVNMSPKEIEEFMQEYGDVAGLSRNEAAAQGIRSGRDSARAIIRMRQKDPEDWTEGEKEWMKRQNSFVARMKGVKGPLYKDGEPTRKLLALKVWGHDPEKKGKWRGGNGHPYMAKKVDLERYAGKWKQESVKNVPGFQKDCDQKTVTAEYKLRKDGKVDVINKCKVDGKTRTAKGIARSVSKDNRRLKVSFDPFGLFEGDYIIKQVNPSYTRAVVKGGKTEWVLTR